MAEVDRKCGIGPDEPEKPVDASEILERIVAEERTRGLVPFGDSRGFTRPDIEIKPSDHGVETR